MVLCYLAGAAFCWYYARTCSGQYCGYVVVVPVLPWIVIAERFLDHDMAFYAYGLIFAINIALAYSVGSGIGWALRKLFKRAVPVNSEPPAKTHRDRGVKRKVS